MRRLECCPSCPTQQSKPRPSAAPSRAASTPCARSTSRSPRGRSSAFSGPTAPASRPRSACSARCCPPPPAAPRSPASMSSTRTTRSGAGSVSHCRRSALTRCRPGASCSSSSAASTAFAAPPGATGAEELLELVGLTEAADRRTKTYSGGMKRRLDLASALVHEPEVLFLDEPTTGLDPASRLTVWDEVRRINAAGTTIFLTTQYLEEADQLCERAGDHRRRRDRRRGHAREAEGGDRPRRRLGRAERG